MNIQNIRKFISVILVMLALALAGANLLVVFKPLPAPEKIDVWIPEGAEIRNSENMSVDSGFRVYEDFDDFQRDSQSAKVIIEYRKNSDTITYWRPEEAVFYYTHLTFYRPISPWWKSIYSCYSWRISYHGGGVFYIEPHIDAGLSIILFLLLTVLAGMIWPRKT